MKFLQTKPSVKSISIENYDFYYTVNKNRDDNEIVKDKYESDYDNFFDFVTPNHYNGRKTDNVIYE